MSDSAAEISEHQFKRVFCEGSEPLWDDLYRFALSLCHSREQAEDIVQESLLRGCKYFERFAKAHLQIFSPQQLSVSLTENPVLTKRLRGWLFRIVRNVFVDLIPDQTESFEEQNVGLDECGEALTLGPRLQSEVAEDQFALELADSENEFFHFAADDRLKAALESLSSRQRSIVYLYCENYSYKEIAEIAEVPIGTVMSGLWRSLDRIRKHLGRASRWGGTDAGSKSGRRQGSVLPAKVQKLRAQAKE